jgi:hypothetical protein
MTREELIAHPDYKDHQSRFKSVDQLDDMVGIWCSTQKTDGLVALLVDNNIPCAPVREIDEFATDPELPAPCCPQRHHRRSRRHQGSRFRYQDVRPAILFSEFLALPGFVFPASWILSTSTDLCAIAESSKSSASSRDGENLANSFNPPSRTLGLLSEAEQLFLR